MLNKLHYKLSKLILITYLASYVICAKAWYYEQKNNEISDNKTSEDSIIDIKGQKFKLKEIVIIDEDGIERTVKTLQPLTKINHDGDWCSWVINR